jgi:hypothetical protein
VRFSESANLQIGKSVEGDEMKLIQSLQAVVVKDALDLTELDPAYVDPETGKGLRLAFRLNWTRAQKEQRQELAEETLECQKAYQRLKELVSDPEAWAEAKETADALGDENWEHWAAWWAEIFLLEVEEVKALAEALPEKHWVWVTSQVTLRAADYEADSLKKAGGRRSRSSGEQQAERR